MSWIAYWNGTTPIYVSARHRLLHGRQIGRDIAAAVPAAGAVVMDYGCGEALGAETVLERCGRLLLVDAADSLRDRLAARFAGDPRVSVLAPVEAALTPEASVDLVVVNSLLQYLDRAEARALLAQVHAWLKPHGLLILADIVPPELSPLADAAALLRFAWAGGFLLAALAGLARTATSGYGRLRRELGFATYAQDEILTLLDHAGFEAQRREPNFGHNQARLCFEARPRAAETPLSPA